MEKSDWGFRIADCGKVAGIRIRKPAVLYGKTSSFEDF